MASPNLMVGFEILIDHSGNHGHVLAYSSLSVGQGHSQEVAVRPDVHRWSRNNTVSVTPGIIIPTLHKSKVACMIRLPRYRKGKNDVALSSISSH